MNLVTNVDLTMNRSLINLTVEHVQLCAESKAQFDKWLEDGSLISGTGVRRIVVESPDQYEHVKGLAEAYFGEIIQNLATKDYDRYSSEDRAVLLGVASRMAQTVKKSELKD